MNLQDWILGIVYEQDRGVLREWAAQAEYGSQPERPILWVSGPPMSGRSTLIDAVMSGTGRRGVGCTSDSLRSVFVLGQMPTLGAVKLRGEVRDVRQCLALKTITSDEEIMAERKYQPPERRLMRNLVFVEADVGPDDIEAVGVVKGLRRLIAHVRTGRPS